MLEFKQGLLLLDTFIDSNLLKTISKDALDASVMRFEDLLLGSELLGNFKTCLKVLIGCNLTRHLSLLSSSQ